MTIDIMMPFYGDPALFKQAVESVRGQTDGDWRLVIIDDVYPDPEPGEWAATLDDPRVEYIRNDTNLGVSGNFQKAVDLATSEYVVIMGCDDIMEPNYVATVHALIHRFPEASYFQPGVIVIDGDGSPVLPLADRVKARYRPKASSPTPLSSEAFATSLLRGNWTYFPSICWRTADVRTHGFNPDYEVVLDLALQLDLVTAGATMVVFDDQMFRYRRHSASVSSWKANDGSRFTEERAFFADMAARMDAMGWQNAARTARRHVSSRLNALTRIPSAALARDSRGLRELIRHAMR
ncbi:hypothetical protein GCM10027416_05980 [Okibacterium endophyticum]